MLKINDYVRMYLASLPPFVKHSINPPSLFSGSPSIISHIRSPVSCMLLFSCNANLHIYE